MNEPPIYQLAQELIDKIIDDLAESWEDDPHSKWRDLSSCSLVCKLFLPPSQSHLFHLIEIVTNGAWDNESCTQRCKELSRILEKSPHITTYIQELRIQVEEDDNAWVHQNATFLQVMDQISQAHCHLEKLTFAFRYWWKPLCNPQAFLDGFARPFISPFITSLHIQGVKNAPIRMIQECINLSDLTLSGVDLECISRSRTSGNHIPRPHLRRLHYCGSHGAIEKLVGKGFTCHPVHLSTLLTLTVEIDRIDDVLCVQSIIKATNSLEELYLISEAITKNYVSLEGRIDLKKSDLRILQVDGVFGESGQECLSGIISILKTVPPINRLQSFHLTIYVGFAVEASPEDLLDADWESLAAQVMNVSSGKPLAFHLFINFLDSSRGVPVQPPRTKMSKSICKSQLRRVVEERLRILRRDSVIAFFSNFHLHVDLGGCYR